MPEQQQPYNPYNEPVCMSGTGYPPAGRRQSPARSLGLTVPGRVSRPLRRARPDGSEPATAIGLMQTYGLLLTAAALADSEQQAVGAADFLAGTAAQQAREARYLLKPFLDGPEPDPGPAPVDWNSALQQGADRLEQIGEEERESRTFNQVMDWIFAVHYVRAAGEVLAMYQRTRVLPIAEKPGSLTRAAERRRRLLALRLLHDHPRSKRLSPAEAAGDQR